MTLRELAYRVGLKENQIHVLCRTNTTKIETLEKISHALNVPMSIFLNNEPKEFSDFMEEIKGPTINDRIEMLVNKYFDGNKAAFAKSIGLLPTGMSSYLSQQRRSKPGIDMIAKIITKFDVDARWLITGDEKAVQPATIRTEGDFSPASETGNINITEVSTDAVAAERIRSLERLIAEKDERIAELKERIADLRGSR